MNYAIEIFSIWAPKVFYPAVFLVAAFFYVPRLSPVEVRKPLYKFLIFSAVFFRIFYAILETAGQYYVWSQNKFTDLLLSSPLDAKLRPILGNLFPFFDNRFGYFLFYSFGRFWLNVFISIGIAFALSAFLKLLRRHNDRFFEEGEVELGFLAALVVGWPNFVVFLPIVFVSVVVISVFRRIVFRELFTTLGAPILLATLATLLFGGRLIEIFHLTVLTI